jgi:tRNA dimethylallyltransferase
MDKKSLLVLTGPTAVGKTEASIQLAKAVNGEIISADSMQVYKGMDIGTAKIRPEQMCGIPHYMIDEFEPDEEFNVFLFQKKVKEYMADIYARGKIPILVGGTGFYIQSVLYDIAFTEEKTDDSYRLRLQREAEKNGAECLHKKLAVIDPKSAETIHANNVKRVIRALEYYHLTGKTFSAHNEEQKKRVSPYCFAYFVLNTDRKILYERIDKRVDEMMAEGLVQEVQGLLDKGYKRSLVSMQGLGYKEIAAALCGECTMEEAVYILKRDTRHFAKRQLTWFRREKDVCMIEKDKYKNVEELAAVMLQKAGEKGVLF